MYILNKCMLFYGHAQKNVYPMNKSKWKGPYMEKKNVGKKIVVKRNSEITPSFIGTSVWVHNGRALVKTEINENSQIGHKMGEFVTTRSEFVFKKSKKKKRK